MIYVCVVERSLVNVGVDQCGEFMFVIYMALVVCFVHGNKLIRKRATSMYLTVDFLCVYG